jgi:A/G-specific adenine glycosylase
MEVTAISKLQASLLLWYDAHARLLPWRNDPTPYRVWVSEIMLQQTRVEAVKPYFSRFIDELPTVAALASVNEQHLLKLWEGLGYYNRAKNLKRAAQVIMNEFGGEIPTTYEELKKLPGIGDYTAGAIASIAFGVRVAAIDGNVLRVFARVMAYDGEITKNDSKKHIEGKVYEIMPQARVGDFNQALMELGATVCLPSGAPKCEECPIKALCRGFAMGIADNLPVKMKKKPRKIEFKTVFVIVCNGKIAIRQRPDEGLLPGLWELPNTQGNLSPSQVPKVLSEWNISSNKIEPLKNAKHIFTHIEWRMTGCLVYTDKFDLNQGFTWVTPQVLTGRVAIPSAFNVYKTIAINLSAKGENCSGLIVMTKKLSS